MAAPVNFRFLLATMALLALFVGAYEAAVQWPGQPRQRATLAPIAKLQPTIPTPTDTLATRAAAPPSTSEAARAEWRVVSSPAQRRVLQVHRYVGTVGGQPATAELRWYTPDTITGGFYLHRGGPEYYLYYYKKGPEPVVLNFNAQEEYTDYPAQEQWQLSSRLGQPQLRATWHDGRRTQIVNLRESYTGAVPYGIRTMQLLGDRANVSRDFLTLPALTTIRPPLRRVLNPSPKARLQQLYAIREGLSTVAYQLSVRLNGFGLFSYQTRQYSRETGGPFDGTPDVDFESTLLDLPTGRPIPVASQLRSGYQQPLQRLLTHHFQHDAQVEDNRERFLEDREGVHLVALPDIDMCLTGAGLEAVYWQPLYPATVRIPYRELRPLVRPGTPLARMLQARGLW